MLMRYEYLSDYPRVFRGMTGLTISEFDQMVGEIEPFYGITEQERLARPDRLRASGLGHPFELDYQDSLLLTLIGRWIVRSSVSGWEDYFFATPLPA